MKFGKKKLVAGVSLLVTGLLGWWLVTSSEQSSDQAATSATGRSAYAQLYDTFWRSDDRSQPTLLTATLFPPSVVSALQRAQEKTVTETQIDDRLRTIGGSDMAIFFTIDSVTGSFTDAEVESCLKVQKDAETATSVRWEPMVTSSRVVNAPAGSSSQQGLAIFHFSLPLVWKDIRNVQMSCSGLPKTTPRSFIWAGGVLAQTEL